MKKRKYDELLPAKLLYKQMTVKSVEFLGAGNHSEAFVINDEFVLKLPKHKKASRSLETEIKVLESLEDSLPLSIPNVLVKATFKSGDEDFVYFLSKKLKGKTLSHDEFADLPLNTKKQCAKILADFLFTLHSHREILDIRRKNLALLHGDFSLNHIMFDDNNLPCAILDFGDTRSGKPLSDFVYLLDEEDEEEFGKGFGKMVLNEYCLLKKKI